METNSNTVKALSSVSVFHNVYKDTVINLIKGFKKCRCLWLDSHPDYHRKEVKAKAYNNLVKIWKCIEPNATKNDVKRKLDLLRASFRREYKKVISREDAGEPYTPTLWYFNQFLFLMNHDEAEVSYSESDDDSINESSPPSKRRARESIDYITQLQDLTEDQRDIALRLISEVIHYGKIGQLTLNTGLVNINQTIDQNKGDNELDENRDETANAVNFMQEEMDKF